MREIITINGRGEENEFADAFARKAAASDIATHDVLSKACAIVVAGAHDVMIVHDNQRLDEADRAFFIRRYRSDAYETHLLARVLIGNERALYVDPVTERSTKDADKIAATIELALCGMPVPASIICTAHSYAMNRALLETRIAYPCVLKKSGSRGKRVWKIDNKTQLMARLEQDSGLTLIQEYLSNDHDFRVFVLDGKILAAIKRTTADGFYNNVSQGGTAHPASITENEAAMCIKAAAIAGLRLAGVDFVRQGDRAYIFEVNKAPQLALFNDAAGFDIEEAVSSHVIKELLGPLN